jgi:ornithine carbamoyltransferase
MGEDQAHFARDSFRMPSGEQCLQVTNDVRESPVAMALDRAEHRLDTIMAVFVAALGS